MIADIKGVPIFQLFFSQQVENTSKSVRKEAAMRSLFLKWVAEPIVPFSAAPDPERGWSDRNRRGTRGAPGRWWQRGDARAAVPGPVDLSRRVRRLRWHSAAFRSVVQRSAAFRSIVQRGGRRVRGCVAEGVQRDPTAATLRFGRRGGASAAFSGEGPRVHSVTLMSSLASSGWCVLIVRTGRVGADFTGGNGRDPMHFHSASPLGKPALTVTLHK